MSVIAAFTKSELWIINTTLQVQADYAASQDADTRIS